MTEREIKIFKRFLKETKSYKLFFKYYNCEFMSGEPSVIQYMKNISPQEVINEAFDWESSRMGFNYWNDLSKKWTLFHRRATILPLEYASSYL